MKIEFIPGKGISTKSIADRVITAHFTVPADFPADRFINKPLALKLSGDQFDLGVENKDGVGLEFDCSMCTDPGTSYYYNPTHDTYAIKLDITLPNLLVMGFILIAELDISVQDNKI